jgi:hypothetical protein
VWDTEGKKKHEFTYDSHRLAAGFAPDSRHVVVITETNTLIDYFHLFAQAMGALGEDSFVDVKNIKHDWRQDLYAELKKRQQASGAWANANSAFQENSPELATAFALLAVSYCRPK